MIPQPEFESEVADYIEIFIKSALRGHDIEENNFNVIGIRAQAEACANLITNLGRSTKFEPWPETMELPSPPPDDAPELIKQIYATMVKIDAKPAQPETQV